MNRRVCAILVGILVSVLLMSCLTTEAYQTSEKLEIKMLDGALPISINSDALEVSRGDQRSRIVIQDILGDRRYSEASKGLSRNDVIPADLDGDGRAEESIIILFNLDIYAYDVTKPGSMDPGAAIERRVTYDRKISRKNPLVVEFLLSDFHSAINQAMRRESFDWGEKLGLYYYDPDGLGGKGSWHPIEDLEKKGEIRIDHIKDRVSITIYEWPKDDRVHGGR